MSAPPAQPSQLAVRTATTGEHDDVRRVIAVAYQEFEGPIADVSGSAAPTLWAAYLANLFDLDAHPRGWRAARRRRRWIDRRRRHVLPGRLG